MWHVHLTVFNQGVVSKRQWQGDKQMWRWNAMLMLLVVVLLCVCHPYLQAGHYSDLSQWCSDSTFTYIEILKYYNI
jgi:hypothetical protein